MPRKSDFCPKPLMRIAALVAAVNLCACTAVQVTVPQDIVASSTAMDIHGMASIGGLFGDGNVDIGPYQVTGVHFDVSDQSRWSLGIFQQHEEKSGFRFVLHGAVSDWTVSCRRGNAGNTVRLFGVDGVAKQRDLHCDLRSGTRLASLDMSEDVEHVRGSMQLDGHRFAIYPYSYGNPQPGVTPVPLGFRIEKNQRSIAAVGLHCAVQLWLGNDVPQEQRAALVAGLAAVLFDQRG